MKTVGEVAELAGVTVRTLHHYDELGLLSPSERSGAGYRLYSHDDLERLQEILIWRQLGFSLVEIVSLLDDPGHDRLAALERQRELVGREIDRLGALAAAVDAAIDAQKNGTVIEEASMFEGFDPTEYEDEARERWGDTEAYQESARRTARYGEAEWGDIGSEVVRRSCAGWRRSCAPASRRTGPRPGRSPSATASTSRAGSIHARRRCTADSARCTSPTSGSRGRTSGRLPGSRSTSTTRSWRAPARPTPTSGRGSVGDQDVARLRGNALEPRGDARVGVELEPGLRRHVGVGVKRDVGDRVALADEVLALGQPAFHRS